MRRPIRLALLVSICTTLFFGCGRGPEEATGPVDPSPPHEGFATVEGVRLHYLDWGGTGPAFVLIHGFCVSPYTFYGLAPALADDFRVIAYARRSHGQSDTPTGGYDNSTLVEDLRGLLDSLGIEKAHLLGWSMGGNEITDFAVRYPDRVGRLVYLEAGYDFSDPDFLEAYGSPPVDFPPDDASLRSLDAYREWWHAVMASGMPWTDDLETCFRDTVRIMPDGTIETRPSGDIFEQCMTSLADTPRDYAGVGVPALALYSEKWLSAYGTYSAKTQAVEAWEKNHMAPFRQKSIERIRRELPNVTVLTIPNTTHTTIAYIEPESLAATIRSFLLEEQ